VGLGLVYVRLLEELFFRLFLQLFRLELPLSLLKLLLQLLMCRLDKLLSNGFEQACLVGPGRGQSVDYLVVASWIRSGRQQLLEADGPLLKPHRELVEPMHLFHLFEAAQLALGELLELAYPELVDLDRGLEVGLEGVLEPSVELRLGLAVLGLDLEVLSGGMAHDDQVQHVGQALFGQALEVGDPLDAGVVHLHALMELLLHVGLGLLLEGRVEDDELLSLPLEEASVDGMWEDPLEGHPVVVLEGQLELVEAARVVAVEDEDLALDHRQAVEVEAPEDLQVGAVLLEVCPQVQWESYEHLLLLHQDQAVLQGLEDVPGELRGSGDVCHQGGSELHQGAGRHANLHGHLDDLDPEELLLSHQAEDWALLPSQILHKSVLALQPVLVERGPDAVQVRAILLLLADVPPGPARQQLLSLEVEPMVNIFGQQALAYKVGLPPQHPVLLLEQPQVLQLRVVQALVKGGQEVSEVVLRYQEQVRIWLFRFFAHY